MVFVISLFYYNLEQMFIYKKFKKENRPTKNIEETNSMVFYFIAIFFKYLIKLNTFLTITTTTKRIQNHFTFHLIN